MKKTAKTDNSSDPKTLCYNILSTICILTLATVLAFSFFHITRSDPANIALIYILALIIIARITSGYVFGIISALFCVIFINWCFTYPYFKVNFQISGYPVTFVFLLSISLIVSTLTTQLKKQDKMILERERAINEADKERIRANLLRAISHDLRTPLTSIIGSSDSFIENYQNLTDPEKILNFYETTRWLNVVGAYWYYFNNKKNFNKAEKKEIYNKISATLKTLERKRIKPKLKLKLGYYPFRNFKLFLLSENIYFRLKKLIGK